MVTLYPGQIYLQGENMSATNLSRQYDVLQSIKMELTNSGILPEELVNLATEIVKAKYSIGDKKRGKVQLSNSLVSLMLSNECFLAEDGTLLALDDKRRIQAVQQALRLGIAALFVADLLGTTRESIRDRILGFVEEILKDKDEIAKAGIADYPVIDGNGWRLILDGDLDQPENIALVSVIMSQEKLAGKGAVVNADRLLSDQNNLRVFNEIKEILAGSKINNEELNMAKEKVNSANESIDEELKKTLESELEEAKKEAKKANKNKIPLWKAALLVAGGVVAGAAGAYAYNKLTDDTTTIYSGN